MTKVIQGLHYGRVNFNHGRLYLSLRPFHWSVDKTVLAKTHQKHFFKDSWIKTGHIVTVNDTPQNNAVLVVHTFISDHAIHVINALHFRGYPIESVLYAKVNQAKNGKYQNLSKILMAMYKYSQKHAEQRKPDDNVIIKYKHNGHTRYKFAELKPKRH